MHHKTRDRVNDLAHPAYLVKKIVWRSWIRFLSWWRRRHVVRT
jgi:hypothetical protein